MVKYCPRCGAQVPDDARFCPRCGFDFSTLEQPYSRPPQIPLHNQPSPAEQPLIEAASKASKYIPTLTRYGKLLLILAIIFEGLTTILFTVDLLNTYGKSSDTITIITFSLMLIAAIFYLIAPIFSFTVKGLGVKKLTITLGLLAFLFLAISYILIAKQTSPILTLVKALTIYGVPLYSNITAGIVILIGIVFILATMFMNLGQLINSVLQVIGVLLIYAFTYSSNFNFESFLWGIAVSMVIIFNLIPYFYRGEYTQMIVAIGHGIGVLIFAIGTLVAGISQISATAPPPYSSSLIQAMYGTYLSAGVLGILAGILGILDSVFILIYTLVKRASPLT